MAGGLRSWVFAVAALAASIGPGSAEAAWFKAETERFIVYGPGSEERVRDYAVKLTTFDAMLRLLHPRAGVRAPRRKFEIYLVNNRADLRRISPKSAGILGFYLATPEDVFAVAVMGDEALNTDEVLFHEYAHYFMLENFPAAYPAWFVEGWAEYFMPTKITPTDVTIGGFNDNRAVGLALAHWVTMEDLLSKRAGELHRMDRGMFYAQSWLLMHYMQAKSERARQLDKAMQAIAAGGHPVTSFEAATGMKAGEVAARLRRYTKLTAIKFATPLKVPPKVEVTTLPPSADDFLLESLRLSSRQVSNPDPRFIAGLRTKAKLYPGDRMADLTLARAEFAMGDVAAGEAIVLRRLEANPNEVDSLRVSAVGQIWAGARHPDQRQERCRSARQTLGKAFQLDKSDYRILYAYAFCRGVESNYPTDNDVTVLLEARALAPSVPEISMRAGHALLARGRRDDAVAVLAPVANNPHGGVEAAAARALIAGKTPAEAQADAPAAEREE